MLLENFLTIMNPHSYLTFVHEDGERICQCPARSIVVEALEKRLIARVDADGQDEFTIWLVAEKDGENET